MKHLREESKRENQEEQISYFLGVLWNFREAPNFTFTDCSACSLPVSQGGCLLCIDQADCLLR